MRSALFLLLLMQPAVLPADVAQPDIAKPDLTNAALHLLRANKQDDAIKLLQDGMAKNPEDAKAATLLTEIYLGNERFPEADQLINSAIAKMPGESDLYRVRADLVFREGQIFEAEKNYREAYKLNNKDARALYGIARCLRSGALRLSAATLIRTAHGLSPGDPDIGSSFEALQPHSSERTAQLQAMLDSLGQEDSDQSSRLKRAIAVARVLNGKQAFEIGSPYAHYQVPLKALSNGRHVYGVGITIQIGGGKSELQLDTGAHGIILSSRFAAKTGVQRVADVNIGGIGNEAPHKGWIGYAESVQIGNLELKHCIVEVSDRGSVVDSGGLIGTDILKRFLVKLNFYERKLELDPLPGPAWDGYAPVNRYSGPELEGYSQILIIEHYLLVPTRVSEEQDSDATPGLFLMDTGASINNVSTTIAPDLTKVRDSHYMRVRGLNGQVAKVYEAEKLVLQFATFRQSNLSLTALDMTNLSRSAGTEVMGIIGMPLLALFHSVTIDYRDGRVRFDLKR